MLLVGIIGIISRAFRPWANVSAPPPEVIFSTGKMFGKVSANWPQYWGKRLWTKCLSVITVLHGRESLWRCFFFKTMIVSTVQQSTLENVWNIRLRGSDITILMYYSGVVSPPRLGISRSYYVEQKWQKCTKMAYASIQRFLAASLEK